jgi:hypothetical protein
MTNNWIKINEDRTNLPEKITNVLVTYRHGWNMTPTVKMAFFEGDNCFYDIDNDFDTIDDQVTHWMPLPKPASN